MIIDHCKNKKWPEKEIAKRKFKKLGYGMP